MAVLKMNIGHTKLFSGAGSLDMIVAELNSKGIKRPFVLTDKGIVKCGLADKVLNMLDAATIQYQLFDDVQSDPKSETVNDATLSYKKSGCDSVIGIGGGSVMDTAKCVALMATNAGNLLDYDHKNPKRKEFSNQGAFLIQIPTTSGTGSEISPYAVITNEYEGRKATLGSSMMLCDVAIADSELTLGLPLHITAMTGADALTHLIEAYTTRSNMENCNPFIDALALQGIALIGKSLKKAYDNGSDLKARQDLMWASTIGGFVLQYGSGATHGLGNVLGGKYHVPHGAAMGILLPYVMKYNHDVCEKKYARIAEELGADISNMTDTKAAEWAVEYIYQLMEYIHIPKLNQFIDSPKELERLGILAAEDKCSRLNAKIIGADEAATIYKKAYEEE